MLGVRSRGHAVLCAAKTGERDCQGQAVDVAVGLNHRDIGTQCRNQERTQFGIVGHLPWHTTVAFVHLAKEIAICKAVDVRMAPRDRRGCACGYVEMGRSRHLASPQFAGSLKSDFATEAVAEKSEWTIDGIGKSVRDDANEGLHRPQRFFTQPRFTSGWLNQDDLNIRMAVFRPVAKGTGAA